MMELMELLADSDWDAPFFKRLANNDTGAAPGHQGGVYIPKDLRAYFPSLNLADVSPTAPTTDERIHAELWDANEFLDAVDTRYQFQTWGGTRTPERRLTDNLAPLTRLARGGDVLLIQRHATDLKSYRLILVRQLDVKNFREIVHQIGKDRWAGKNAWGALGERPVSDADLIAAASEMDSTQSSEFTLFEASPKQVESRRVQLARTTAFRRSVTALYSQRCAACNTALCTAHGLSELEAAHVVPRQRGGVNDARNGLGLCRRHHWAFDRGLFGIDEERHIYVPASVRRMPANEPLIVLHGKPIREASRPVLMANSDALQWHFANIVNRLG